MYNQNQEKELLYSKKRGVGYITLNREEHQNTITSNVIKRFLEVLNTAEQDNDVKVVCITSSGNRIFCSGADLSSIISDTSSKDGEIFKNYANLLIKISRFEKPTLAKINGHCFAGGTGFMLACDIVLARDDVKFGTPEVNVGLFPMMIGTLIFRNVQRKKAMEMILLGEKISAKTACDIGMVTRIFSEQNFEEQCQKVIEALSMKSSIGVKLGKRSFNDIESMSFEKAIHFLSEQLLIVTKTYDAKEGINSFFERRDPVFKGK